MFNHVSIDGVGSGRALYDPNSNPLQCSGQGNEELQADKEGDVAVDLVHKEFDSYQAAISDHPVGNCDSFLHSKPHNCSPNILHNKVCIIFTFLFNSGRLFPFSHIIFPLYLSVSLVFLISILSMTGIIPSARVDNVDVVAMNFLPVILFGVFSIRYIELMYPEGIQQL
jgi:hypothetical protein